jgi:hypothetical protein
MSVIGAQTEREFFNQSGIVLNESRIHFEESQTKLLHPFFFKDARHESFPFRNSPSRNCVRSAKVAFKMSRATTAECVCVCGLRRECFRRQNDTDDTSRTCVDRHHRGIADATRRCRRRISKLENKYAGVPARYRCRCSIDRPSPAREGGRCRSGPRLAVRPVTSARLKDASA